MSECIIAKTVSFAAPGVQKAFPQRQNRGVSLLKIFFSHASQSKPIVKTIMKYLPANLMTWLDENNLLWGDQLAPAFETAIKTEADYVILFVNEIAARSEWVHKEVRWALEREKELKRSFLLPVFLHNEGNSPMDSYFPELANRKYIHVMDYTEFGLKTVADSITASLFALICEDLARMQNPPPMEKGETIHAAEQLIADLARKIQEAIFPYREDNPISVEDLCTILQRDGTDYVTEENFDTQINHIIQRNLIPGLYYDGYELYLIEEHSRWKSGMNHDSKVAIARKAAAFIRSGMSVYIDAGSTTEEVIRILCKRIEMRKLSNLKIVTPSVNHADMISECCVRMGFEDDFTAVELYMPGGCVRPGTQALIPFPGREDTLQALCDMVGGYDLAIVGANGFTARAGATTHANKELLGKRTAFTNAKKRLIVFDSSKVGIELDSKIADLSEDMILISNDTPPLRELQPQYPDKIILVR